MVGEGAVVVGGFVNALGIVRALAGHRITVALVTTEPHDIAQHSRWTAEAYHAAADAHPENLLALLEANAARWRGRVVFPTDDATMGVLSANAPRLAADYRLAIPPADAVATLLDKRLMTAAAAAAGIPLPRIHGEAAPETIADVPEGAFPVLVKPTSSHRFRSRFRRKLFLARDRAELTRRVGSLRDAGLEGMIVDLVPGEADRIHCYCVYLDRNGHPGAGLTVRKLRESPGRFGVARVAEIVDADRALREPSIELLRRIGFRGMASVEYKQDPRDGVHRFIEVNGRSVIYNALVRRGGLDLASTAWHECTHGRPPRSEPVAWPGRWIHVHADVLRAVIDRESISLRQFLAPYRRPLIFAVWSRRDPGPFLAEWGHSARRAPAEAWRRVGGDSAEP